MEIKKLHISNFKSIGEKGVTIHAPNPFSVFVGPNASGKSNFFEALEFFNFISKSSSNETFRLFGGTENITHKKYGKKYLGFEANFKSFDSYVNLSTTEIFEKSTSSGSGRFYSDLKDLYNTDEYYIKFDEYIQFFNNFSRIFIRNKDLEKIKYEDDQKLSLSCRNLESVLKRILKNENIREDIIEWLQLLVPGFENIEIQSSELSGTDSLLIYEKGFTKPFTKNLLSDGTYNILSILAAVFQSDKPQFLCIEEPENGLNPKVIKELVNLFRDKTGEGHFIWLNTHSQTLVSQLKEEEIIIVDKIEGETRVKQIEKGKSYGLKLDEAWLTNVLGGGNPW